MAAGRKISSAIDGPLTLSSPDNPLIITTPGTVTSTGANDDGIDGSASTVWTITNRGTISSAEGWGINLAGAGALDNSGLISGLLGGFTTGEFGTVTNKGTISSGGGSGIFLPAGGSVMNRGSISGRLGVQIGSSGTITNKGTIVGSLVGIGLSSGGSVTNENGGSITGRTAGVSVGPGSGSVINKGTIRAGLAVIMSSAGGSVTNEKDGSIVGVVDLNAAGGTVTNRGTISGLGSGGVRVHAVDGTVTNTGTITAGNSGSNASGVILTAGGSVTNEKGGSIAGVGFLADVAGVEVSGGSGTVTNKGTISGPTHSVLFDAGTTNNLLVVNPGAVFNGSADATAATNSTIELTRGRDAISGIGNDQFLGFNTLVVDRGGHWTLNGADAIATVLNNGTLDVAGTLHVTAAVDPHSEGVFQLEGGSVLEVAAAIGSDTKMNFETGSELVVDDFRLFGRNVGAGDYDGSLLRDFSGATIDLKGFGIAGLHESFSPHSGLLQLTNAVSQVATLEFQTSSLGAGIFRFNSDGGSGVLITHS